MVKVECHFREKCFSALPGEVESPRPKRIRAESICWSKSLSPKSSTSAGFALGQVHDFSPSQICAARPDRSRTHQARKCRSNLRHRLERKHPEEVPGADPAAPEKPGHGA